MSNKQNNNDDVVLQIGTKYYNALEVYAKSKGMTVDEVFAKAVNDYIETNFTETKDVLFGDKTPMKSQMS